MNSPIQSAEATVTNSGNRAMSSMAYDKCHQFNSFFTIPRYGKRAFRLTPDNGKKTRDNVALEL